MMTDYQIKKLMEEFPKEIKFIEDFYAAFNALPAWKDMEWNPEWKPYKDTGLFKNLNEHNYGWNDLVYSLGLSDDENSKKMSHRSTIYALYNMAHDLVLCGETHTIHNEYPNIEIHRLSLLLNKAVNEGEKLVIGGERFIVVQIDDDLIRRWVTDWMNGLVSDCDKVVIDGKRLPKRKELGYELDTEGCKNLCVELITRTAESYDKNLRELKRLATKMSKHKFDEMTKLRLNKDMPETETEEDMLYNNMCSVIGYVVEDENFFLSGSLLLLDFDGKEIVKKIRERCHMGIGADPYMSKKVKNLYK